MIEENYFEEPIEQEENEEKELYEHYRIVADRGQSVLRIDKFLMARIENATRNKIQQATKAGNVLVNEKVVKSNYKVKPGDIITIVLTYPPRDTTIYAENIPLNIVYEDADLVIVNKAPGMVVHPGHGNFTGTLLHALKYHFEQNNETCEPFLVHRIDKDTSGLMVVTKNELAQARLAKQFYDHSLDRKYAALVWGDLKNDAGTINASIARNPSNRMQMMAFPANDIGRHAITHYNVIRRYGYVTLVECRLETGRTHQIRAHMTFLKHPLFNDARYGGNEILKGTTFAKYKHFVNNCFAIMPRQALHARILGFIHPTTGEHLLFESEFPADLSQILEKWENYSIQQFSE